MAGGLLGKKLPDDEDENDLEIQADDDSPGGEEPPPEDTSDTGDGQATYDMFVKNAMRVIFSKDALPTVLKSIAAGAEPVVGIARTLAMLLVRVVGSAQQDGTEITDDVVKAAASELLGHLADLAGEAGVHKYTPKERAAALYLALQLYQRLQNGPTPPGAGAQQQPPPDQGDQEQMPPQRQPTGLAAAA